MSLEEKILAIVKEHADCEVEAATRFEDLPLDSLEFMGMIRDVETATDIIIGDEHLSYLGTVGELTRYVQNRLVIHDHISG